MHNLAIIGATGLVGSKVLSELEESSLKVDKLYLVASSASAGKKLLFRGEEIRVIEHNALPKENIQLAFNAVSSELTKEIMPKLLAIKGITVIDKSSCNRMRPDVPLIAAGVNDELVSTQRELISVPNCCVIPVVWALKPLDAAYKIKRIVLSTYQSASGAGSKTIRKLLEDSRDDLANQVTDKNLNARLAFNILPLIGQEEEQGYTGEEIKICQEIKKILGHAIKVSATAARVAVAVGHCICLNAEFDRAVCAKESEKILESSGCKIRKPYIAPREVEGSRDVFVSRLRNDQDLNTALNMWITADNLLRGAATNAVEIACLLSQRGLLAKNHS